MRLHLGMVALGIALHASPAAALELLTEVNPPLNYERAGKAAGWSSSIVTEMARRAGMPAQPRVMAWQQAFDQARDGADACVFSTVRNAEREGQFQWVGPIARGQYAVFSGSSFRERPRDLGELKAFRIAVVDDARAAYLKAQGFTNLVLFKEDAEAARALSGRGPKAVDLWVTQAMRATAVAASAGVYGVKLVYDNLIVQDYWLACGKKVPAEAVAKLAAALESMQKDGTQRQILTAAP